MVVGEKSRDVHILNVLQELVALVVHLLRKQSADVEDNANTTKQ